MVMLLLLCALPTHCFASSEYFRYYEIDSINVAALAPNPKFGAKPVLLDFKCDSVQIVYNGRELKAGVTDSRDPYSLNLPSDFLQVIPYDEFRYVNVGKFKLEKCDGDTLILNASVWLMDAERNWPVGFKKTCTVRVRMGELKGIAVLTGNEAVSTCCVNGYILVLGIGGILMLLSGFK